MYKIRSDNIRKEPEVMPILSKIEKYRRKWKEHLERVISDRIPKASFIYHPEGKRDRGRPRKRWIEIETGL